MNSISPSQKKTIIISGSAALILLFGVIFVYMPALRKIGVLKDELLAAQDQIEQIEASLGNGRSIAEGIRLLKGRYHYLDMKFPQKEEEALRMISELAKEGNISIVTTKSQSRTPFLDEENKNVTVEGKMCQVVSVSLEMKSGYKDLGQYLETLQGSLPAYATIERLRMQKESGTAPGLRITLELNLYLLS